jgi:hypothetical protein
MQIPRAWWERRRLRYNVGLVVAGLLAFVCYVVVVWRAASNGAMPGDDEIEITLFTTAFQTVGYLFMMSLVKPTDVDRYRRVTFRLGFWVSVLLPFGIPALVAWKFLVRHSAVVVP